MTKADDSILYIILFLLLWFVIIVSLGYSTLILNSNITKHLFPPNFFRFQTVAVPLQQLLIFASYSATFVFEIIFSGYFFQVLFYHIAPPPLSHAFVPKI